MARIVLAVFAVLSFVQQAPATGNGIIAGQVVDSVTKQPVAGVVVALLSIPPPQPGGAPPPPLTATVRRALTTTDGRFVFREIPAATYTLSATRAGYSGGALGRMRPNGVQRSITVTDSARITDTTIPIFRLPTITGTVRDDRGEPAVGVYVTSMRRTISGGRAELAFSSGEATDERGHYRIALLEPGSYVVMVQSNMQTAPVSTVSRYRDAVASGSAQEVARELREGGALQMATEGIVIDEWQVSTRSEGSIWPGPNGTLFHSPLTFYGGTGSAGTATVLTLAPGDHREGVDFTLPVVAGVRVSGTVTGLERPAASYGVQLLPVPSGNLAYPFPVAYSLTDASGRFAFLGVAPGSYTARVTRIPPTGPLFVPAVPAAAGVSREIVTIPAPDTFPAMFAEAAVTVGDAHVDGVSLAFQPGASVSGRIVFDGTAPALTSQQLQRVEIFVRSIFGGDSRGFSATARPDESGTFKTTGLAPGRYLMGAAAASPGAAWFLSSIRVGGVDASDHAITIGATDVTDVVVTFTTKSQTLTGSVRAADSSGSAEATVVVFPTDHKVWLANGMSDRRFAAATTTSTGAYRLRLTVPGEYLVVAIPPDIAPDIDPEFIARFAASAIRVTIAAGETKTQALTVSRVR